MATGTQRIAINSGGGYVPGLNAVVTGAVLAADRLGWEVVGIRDGYDGLLVGNNYPDGGLIKLTPRAVERLHPGNGSILGTAARNDPFHMRMVNADNLVEEVDRSQDLLNKIRAEKIDAIISIVGGSALTGAHALSVALKLSGKGLRTVCVPKSVENDVAATALSFGYNSALDYTTETLERVRTAARDVHRIAVVEVLGHQAGWLALQSGMAVCADAVLIPEIPYELGKVAAKLLGSEQAGRMPSLVVVAEGARSKNSIDSSGNDVAKSERSHALRKSLSPLSDPRFGEGARVIDRSGLAAESVALKLQQLTDHATFPLVLGQLIRAGAPTAVDRQLGLGYGAGAVRALSDGKAGVMVVFQPPDLKLVPLAEAINKIRTVPPDSEFVKIARSLGICLGD
jgi:ATP-dependent phosphofructokinase / diphosphate-dependent phosphofructokinase